MRFLLILTLFVSTISFAQPEGYAVDDIGQTHYSICSSKKNVGIYSKAKGDFLDPPHKGYVLHFPETQLLLDVYPKEKELKLYHYYGGNIQQIEGVTDSTYLLFGYIENRQWDEKLLMEKYSGKGHLDHSEGIMVSNSADDRNNYSRGSGLSVMFDKSYLVVNLTHNNCKNAPYVAIQSIEDPMMDSIDAKGNVVYYPRDCQQINASGVFNLKTGKWDIPAKYEGVKEWEGIFGAYNWQMADYNANVDGGYVFDFYKKSKIGVVETAFMNYRKFAFPLELWPIEDEEVWYDYDSTFVYHKTKKGAVGMYQIPLNGKILDSDGYSLNWMASEGTFDVTEILPAEYTNIVLSGNVMYTESGNEDKNYYILALKESGLFDILFIHSMRNYQFALPQDTLFRDVQLEKSLELYEANIYLTDTTTEPRRETIAMVDDTLLLRINPQLPYLNDNVTIVRVDNSDGWEDETHYSAEIVDNGHIIFNSYTLENTFDRKAIWSEIEPMMDSLDENGNVVYYPPMPGIYHSGVFDPENNKWIIPPNEIQIFNNNGGYLIESPVLNDNRNLEEVRISFKNRNGEAEFEGLEEEPFQDKKYRKYKVNGYEPTAITTGLLYHDHLLRFYTDEGSGFALLGRLSSDILLEPTDMAFMGPEHVIFFVDTATLHLRFADKVNKDGSMIDVVVPIDSGTIVSPHFKSTYSYWDRRDWDYYYVPETYNYSIEKGTRRTYYRIEKNCDSCTVFYDEIRLDKKDTVSDFRPSNFMESRIGSTRTDYDFRATILSKDLVYFEYNQTQFTPLVEVKSVWDPLMDSIDENGNTVYYPRDPGFYASGVYNVTQEEWPVKPRNIRVEWISGDNFLLHKPMLDENDLIIGSAFVLKQGEREKVLKEVYTGTDKFFYCGRINDSLIFVNDLIPEQDMVPLMSELYYEDSLDDDGNVVYSEFVKAKGTSGVFNVNTDEWFLPQEYFNISLGPDFFIVSKPIYDKYDRVDYYVYSVYDLSGYLMKSEFKYESLAPMEQEFTVFH